MAGPSSSGAIELLALEGHVVFGVVVQDSRGLAKMPVYLSALVRTREQDGATARAGVQGGHLVEGRDLAPGLEDATLGTPAHWSIHTFSLGPPGHAHYWCSSYNHSGFALPARKLHLRGHLGKGQRWRVGATHEQPLQHHLVEAGVGSSDQKPVRLDQQPLVDVLALGLLAPKPFHLCCSRCGLL